MSLGWGGREDEKERESLFSLHALMEGWENEFCVRVALENYSGLRLRRNSHNGDEKKSLVR